MGALTTIAKATPAGPWMVAGGAAVRIGTPVLLFGSLAIGAGVNASAYTQEQMGAPTSDRPLDSTDSQSNAKMATGGAGAAGVLLGIAAMIKAHRMPGFSRILPAEGTKPGVALFAKKLGAGTLKQGLALGGAGAVAMGAGALIGTIGLGGVGSFLYNTFQRHMYQGAINLVAPGFEMPDLNFTMPDWNEFWGSLSRIPMPVTQPEPVTVELEPGTSYDLIDVMPNFVRYPEAKYVSVKELPLFEGATTVSEFLHSERTLQEQFDAISGDGEMSFVNGEYVPDTPPGVNPRRDAHMRAQND